MAALRFLVFIFRENCMKADRTPFTVSPALRFYCSIETIRKRKCINQPNKTGNAKKNGVEKSEIERGGGAIIHGAMNRELFHTRHMSLLLFFCFVCPYHF